MPLSILVLTAIINFGLAALVYTKRHRIAGSNFFFWFVCFLSLWSISVFIYYENAALLAGRLSFTFVLLSLGFLYLFGRTFTKQTYTLRLWDYSVFSICILFALLSLFTPLILSDIEILDGLPSANYGTLYNVAAVFILATLLAFITNALTNYHSAVGLQKNQIRFFLSGLVVFIVLAVTSNLVLPLLGVGEFSFLGPLFSIFFIMSTTYAITRHRLFDIKIQSQRMVNILFPVALSAGITFFTLSLMPNYYSSSPPEALALVFLLGIFCYAGFRYAMLNTRLGYIFFHKTYHYRTALQNMAIKAPTIIDSQELSSEIVSVFINEMSIQQAGLLLLNTKRSNDDLLYVMQHTNYTTEQLKKLRNCSAEVLEQLEHDPAIIVLDELVHHDNSTSTEEQLYTLLSDSDTAMLVPLHAKNSLIGFIALGHKVSGFYTKDDIELLHDVSKELAIAIANAKLRQQERELGEIKLNILETTSHQMRTPLSIIRNTLQVLLDDYIKADIGVSGEDAEEMRIYLHNAFLSSENLRNTLETVLAASELTGDGVSVNTTKIKTKAFFNERVERIQLLLKSTVDKNLNLIVHLDEELPTSFNQDKKKLGLIIDQLLINAVQYTPEGEIRFEVEALDNKIRISIADTGIGIPQEDQSKLFQQFVRLKNAKLTVPDGNGLSLYLAKQYITMLHGSISFTSTLDEGSTFLVEVPLP